MVWLVLGWTSTSAARTRCFAETGFCVSDPILAYWEKNGGLAVFGYPLGVLHDETIEGSWRGPTQWFERDRLEDHGAQGVLAGRLGALARERQGRPWQQGSETPQAGCRYFDVTGYTVCEPFLAYWQKIDLLFRDHNFQLRILERKRFSEVLKYQEMPGASLSQ